MKRVSIFPEIRSRGIQTHLSGQRQINTILIRCYGLNCVPCQIHMLNPSVMGFGDGAFGR